MHFIQYLWHLDNEWKSGSSLNPYPGAQFWQLSHTPPKIIVILYSAHMLSIAKTFSMKYCQSEKEAFTSSPPPVFWSRRRYLRIVVMQTTSSPWETAVPTTCWAALSWSTRRFGEPTAFYSSRAICCNCTYLFTWRKVTDYLFTCLLSWTAWHTQWSLSPMGLTLLRGICCHRFSEIDYILERQMQ